MKSDKQLESLEKEYFKLIHKCLEKDKNYILSKLKTLDTLKKDWLEIAFDKKTNLFDRPAERIVGRVLLKNLKWPCLPIPISSDECFELKDAVIHVDVKTQLGTERYDIEEHDQVNLKPKIKFKHIIVGRNQTTLPRTRVPFRGKRIEWKPNLPPYYTFGKIKKPCLTYFVRLTYNMICPRCGKIQDIGPSKQKIIKNYLRRETKKYICCPYGKEAYSKSQTCKKVFLSPSFRLDDITVYAMPNYQLIKNYYGGNWFAKMCYKSPVMKKDEIIGISSARLKIKKLNIPTKIPRWWKGESWNREHSIKFEPKIIIKGE